MVAFSIFISSSDVYFDGHSQSAMITGNAFKSLANDRDQKGLNMKKILALIALPYMITSCGTFPVAHDYWRLNNQSVAYDQLEADMLACGFKNTVNNADMSNNLYIKSSLCMEKKGYLFNGKKTCDKSSYSNEIACKDIK